MASGDSAVNLETGSKGRGVVSDFKICCEIDFLEYHLSNSIVPECIQKFVESPSPTVRKLVFTIFNQHCLRAKGHSQPVLEECDPTPGCTSEKARNGLNQADNESLVQQMIHDPFYRVRLLSIAHIDDPRILLKFLKDQNTDIRLAILKKIGEFKQSMLSEELLIKLCHLINDRDVSVRVEFSRLLGRFCSSDEAFCSRLFDKTDIGLFVYGAEDEIDTVRENVINAVGNFPSPMGVDYLIDMINEESEDIRVSILVVLKACTKKQSADKLSITKSQAKYILNMIEESNLAMQRNILKILSRIKYLDTEIFFDLYGRMNVEDRHKFPCLISIAKNNPSIFSEYLHRKFSPVLDHQLPLSDHEYVGNLLIAFALRRSIGSCCRRLKEDFRFIKLKIFDKKHTKNPSKLYKELEKYGVVKDGRLQVDISRDFDHFCSITSGPAASSDDSEEFFRIIFSICKGQGRIRHLDALDGHDPKKRKLTPVDGGKVDRSKASSIGIYQYRFSIPQNLADYTKISKIDYILSTPDIVYRNPNCHVCFRADVLVSKCLRQEQADNIKLVVTDSADSIVFDFANSINVSVLTDCTSIVCFVALMSEFGVFDLTPRKAVAVEVISYS